MRLMLMSRLPYTPAFLPLLSSAMALLCSIIPAHTVCLIARSIFQEHPRLHRKEDARESTQRACGLAESQVLYVFNQL